MTTPTIVFWMERAVDGSAAGAHLRGTLARLKAIDAVSVRSVIADRQSEDGAEGYVRKVFRLARLMLHGAAAARRGRLLIARSHPLILPVALVWRATGGRVILSVQGSLDDFGGNEYPWLKDSRLFRRLAGLSNKSANGLIAGAPVLEDHIRAEMLGKHAHLVSIPNGVFVDELAAARDTERPMPAPYAVFVGNLASWQGIATMIEATSSPYWPADLPLVVIGDGSEASVVRSAAHVKWLGRLPSAEASRWLAHSYCALALKRSDTPVGRHGYWPFKLIESAAVGVPMVCSDARGMSEAAQELGHGIVVEAQNAEAAARAILALWEDPVRRSELAESGMRNVAEHDWAAGAPRLEHIIGLVMKES